MMDVRPTTDEEKELLKKKRIVGVVILAVVVLLIVGLTFWVGSPLLNAIKNKTSFRQWMQERGFLKYPLMVGIMALQVVIALIPGEPIEIGAGFIFGAWGGAALCLLGAALGSVIIILAVRRFGRQFVRLFFTDKQIENVRYLSDPRKRDAAVFIMFLIPGTPKDVLTYVSGLVPIHLGKYLAITTLARIPSVLSSTLGGSMLGQQEYRLAVIVFVITMAISLVGALIYRHYHNKAEAKRAQEEKAAETGGVEASPAAETKRIETTGEPYVMALAPPAASQAANDAETEGNQGDVPA